MVSSLESSSQSSLIGGLFGSSDDLNFTSGKITTEEAEAILTSRRYLENFIIENNLLKVLFPLSWDNQAGKWKEEIEEVPSTLDGYEMLSNSLEISFDKSLVTVELTLHDADNIAVILNNLIKGVNSFIREDSIVDSGKNISFLQKEINKTILSDSKDMLYRLIEQQTQSIMLANTREDFAFRIIDPAMEPIHPAGPNRRLIVIIGSILGFIFSSSFVLLLNFIKISRST